MSMEIPLQGMEGGFSRHLEVADNFCNGGVSGGIFQDQFGEDGIMFREARMVGVSEFRCWTLSWKSQEQAPVEAEELADTCEDNAVWVCIVG